MDVLSLSLDRGVFLASAGDGVRPAVGWNFGSLDGVKRFAKPVGLGSSARTLMALMGPRGGRDAGRPADVSAAPCDVVSPASTLLLQLCSVPPAGADWNGEDDATAILAARLRVLADEAASLTGVNPSPESDLECSSLMSSSAVPEMICKQTCFVYSRDHQQTTSLLRHFGKLCCVARTFLLCCQSLC